MDVAGSFDVMMRTLKPSWIMACAMLWNLALSPSAFWMSALMPAAANALTSAGRSAVSQRVEDWVSGRITPTEPPAAAAGLETAAGADVAAAGALVAAAGAD